MKAECNIKNITAFCGHSTKLRLFIADLTTTAAVIYELDINWLCDDKLNSKLLSLGVKPPIADPQPFTFRKYQPNNGSLSTSNSSLNSNFSMSSVATTSTTLTARSSATFTTQHSLPSGSNTGSMKGTYTSLCFDPYSKKLLAAKCDKQKKTVIEIYNSETISYEYMLENSKDEEKPFRRVTSMSCTNDGKVVCVDLVQNCVKMFRFI